MQHGPYDNFRQALESNPEAAIIRPVSGVGADTRTRYIAFDRGIDAFWHEPRASKKV